MTVSETPYCNAKASPTTQREEHFECKSPEDTFVFGVKLGRELQGGEVILLYGELGAGKTLLTKGILSGLDYDVDDVTSPSFTLVNLYKTEKFDVYHIDLWRLDPDMNPAAAVGLDEILENENAVVIIEWADRLGRSSIGQDAMRVNIQGDGDEPREISIYRQPRVPESEATRSALISPRIVIRKSEQKVELFDGDKFIRSYTAVLGRDPVGDKEIEGDNRTPEGEFYIFVKNHKSQYHLSLGLSYPNAEAAARGLKNGLITSDERNEIIAAIREKRKPPQNTKLGGEIYIHGGAAYTDATRGCISLADEDIEELYNVVAVGTPVSILP